MNLQPATILRGYLTQLIHGCDNVKCLNKYCRSCKDFKYKFDDDVDQAKQEALKLFPKYPNENYLCDGLLMLYFDTKNLEVKGKEFASLINTVDFNDVKIEFDREKVVSYMKDFDLLPYILSPENLTDDKIDQLFEYILKNNQSEPFSSLQPLLPDFIKKLIEPSKMNNTRYHFKHCIAMLLYLTLFPVDELSQLFTDLVLHIDKAVTSQSEISEFFVSQFSKTPKLIKRILSFAQDNLTFAAINDENPQSPVIIGIARLFEILRLSNLNLPSSIFSNELFTTQLLTPQQEVEKLVNNTNLFKYLEAPAVLTLPFKFECLNLYYLLIQSSFTQMELIQVLLNPSQKFFTILVKRSDLYKNTMEVLSKAKPDQLSRHLRVIFEGEEGVDAGGVSREFFYLNCNEIFSDKYGMFVHLTNGKYWFRWSMTPLIEPIYYKTLGTLVFLALYNSVILPIRFPKLLYKKLLHMKLLIEDYEEIDESLVRSLQDLRKMKENGEDISKIETTFSITRDNYGQIVEIPLCEGGEDKLVTNDNVEEYIELYADWLMNKSLETQFRSFENGFNIISNARVGRFAKLDIINQIFNFDELDILVSGEEIVNWEQLKVNSQYIDGYTEDSEQVKWFWEIFDEMTEKQKKNFFLFSTGSDRAPVGGLEFFHLKIQKTNDPTKLPVAHTCMNIFALPNYSSKEEMKQKVLTAIANTEGFGLI